MNDRYVYRKGTLPLGHSRAEDVTRFGRPVDYASVTGCAGGFSTVQLSIDSGAGTFMIGGSPSELRAIAAAIVEAADAIDAADKNAEAATPASAT